MKTYKYPITKLEPNQIFVFGSNTQGRHGKGAALWAKQNAGAKTGISSGFYGKSYAIVTKDLTIREHPSITMDRIYRQLQDMYSLAKYSMKNYEFIISWNTRPNLNAYTPQEMAHIFNLLGKPTDNIIFEEEFAKLLNL